MSVNEAKELIMAAMSDEGDMVHCFDVNAYSGEIPRGNEAKRTELMRLALAALDECQTCGGSKRVSKPMPKIPHPCNDVNFKRAEETIPCPRCQPKLESPLASLGQANGEFRQKVTCALLDCRSGEQQLKVALKLLHEAEDLIERLCRQVEYWKEALREKCVEIIDKSQSKPVCQTCDGSGEVKYTVDVYGDEDLPMTKPCPKGCQPKPEPSGLVAKLRKEANSLYVTRTREELREAADCIEQLEAELSEEKAEREIEKTVDSEAVLGLRDEVEQLEAENKRLTERLNTLVMDNGRLVKEVIALSNK